MMTALMLEFPIDAMALPGVSPESLARAAHSPLDNLGIIDARAQSMRAVAWLRSNSFANSD